MDESQLRALIASVKDRSISRRTFVNKMVALGLTAPLANAMLEFSGVARAKTRSEFEYKPTKRGGGGSLKLLWWQAPTLLNPHFAVGTKDQEACRIFYEPLAAWDPDGELVPMLAADIPSRENGGVAADGMSVVWKLKRGVQWHDGAPFTAEDVVFNWQYASDPATAAVTIGTYKDIRVEKVDDFAVRVVFEKPTPFWAEAFVGPRPLIPKHLFGSYVGANSRSAPANLKPIGTGPYKFVDFKPGDLVRGEINTNYHPPNRPHFDTIEMKGGGDAVSAARAVMQSGEYDYAWNMQVEDEVLLRLEKGGKGKALITVGGNIEHIQLNNSDPWNEIDGERSSAKTRHPVLSDLAVREALALLVDRQSVQDHIYGRTGFATGNFLNAPARFVSKNTKWEFNIEKANQTLEAAGWKRGADGVREKDGRKLRFLYQTSINTPRQKTQAIVKQAAQKAGIDMEIKSVTPSVFFSSDVANPDTSTKFYADIQMFQFAMVQPDPGVFMRFFVSWRIPTKENKWQGFNVTRYRSEEYDTIFLASESELDPVKRAALLIKLNDIICADRSVIPIVHRPSVSAISHKLRAPISGWDNDLWNLRDWWREG